MLDGLYNPHERNIIACWGTKKIEQLIFKLKYNSIAIITVLELLAKCIKQASSLPNFIPLIDEIDKKSELPLAVQMQVLQYLSGITERQKEAQWNRDNHRNHPLKKINWPLDS